MESKGWLKFAEKIFVRAMDGICESCPRVGNFLPDIFERKIKYFITVINSAKIYKRKKIR
jgi:hypothetical protein